MAREFSNNKQPVLTKFADNDVNRLERIKEILDGFQDDCEAFLRHFVEKNDITFTCFKKVWLEQSMCEFFENEQFASLTIFGTYFYNILIKFVIFSESNYVRVGALYLMYTVHRKKYFGPAAKIRLTTDHFSSLRSWIDKLLGYGIYDVGFAFNFLKASEVFLIVTDSRSFGLENKYALAAHSVKNNIFDLKGTLNGIPINIFEQDEVVNLRNFERIDQEYEELLGKFVKNPVKSAFQISVVDQLKQQLRELHEVIDAPEEEVDEIEEDEEGDEIEVCKGRSKTYTMAPINYKILNENLKKSKG